MRVNRKVIKMYKFELEFTEEELSMLRKTLGQPNLPDVVSNSHTEFKKKDLAELYDSMVAILQDD